MPSNIKKINVIYNSMDDESPLTNGDTVEGEVTVEVEKECRISSLYVKFKGKANVLWSETSLNKTKVFRAKVKYFSIRHYFVNEKSPKESHILTPGIHVYPFCYQFPEEGIPSSFNSRYGSVTYSLEAVLSRKMRLDKKSTIPINFVEKIDLNSNPELMEPKSESLEKKMKIFTTGSVTMDVDLERTCFFQGEELSVSLRIQNNSPHDIKPKYSIYKKTSYFARKKRKCQTKEIVNEVGTPVPPSASENVTKVLTIPEDVKPSMLNCKIIKVEYRLKVYLDVKRALDPEIKIEIVILPSSGTSCHPLAGWQDVSSCHPGTRVEPGSYPPADLKSHGNYETPDPPAWDFARRIPRAVLQPSGHPSFGGFGTNPYS